jgi:hypothetical protein
MGRTIHHCECEDQATRARTTAPESPKTMTPLTTEYPALPIFWAPPQNANLKVNLANESSMAYILNNEQRCQGDFAKNPNLFIFVESAVYDFDRRRVWRSKLPFFQTYGDKRVTFMFILALPEDNLLQGKVVYESTTHGDIIQLNYTDVYTALVLKTVAGMRWVAQYCAHAQFIIKTDVDVFVNVHAIFDFLKDLKSDKKEYFYGGCQTPVVAVIRKGQGPQKWIVTKEQYPYETYPPYISGSGILIAKKTIRRLLTSADFVKYFIFEDVYVGMLAQASNINITNVAGFVQANGNRYSKKFDYCTVKNQKVMHSFQNPRQLEFFWISFETFARYGYAC